MIARAEAEAAGRERVEAVADAKPPSWAFVEPAVRSEQADQDDEGRGDEAADDLGDDVAEHVAATGSGRRRRAPRVTAGLKWPPEIGPNA